MDKDIIYEKDATMGKKRDTYLDFMKGVAAINIIMIHTVFWLGESYVPEIVKSMALVLDVPFFFFCSGVGFTYVRSFKKTMLSLLNLYKKYLFFLFFYFICLILFGIILKNYDGITLENFVNNMFFLRTENTALRVVMGSVWFMPVYFTVIPIGSYIVTRLYYACITEKSQTDEKDFMRLCRIALLIIFMGLIYTYLGKNFFYFSSTTLVYLFFWMLGVVCSRKKIQHFYSVVIIDCGILIFMKVMAKYLNVELRNMQSLKFPPSIIYVAYSLVIIVLALYAKSKLKISDKNVFSWIGKNAIYYYFCQGISSSLLMYFIPSIRWEWYIKLPVAFSINFIVTCIFVVILKKIYEITDKIISHLICNIHYKNGENIL